MFKQAQNKLSYGNILEYGDIESIKTNCFKNWMSIIDYKKIDIFAFLGNDVSIA
jgi:hypothetical protein